MVEFLFWLLLEVYRGFVDWFRIQRSFCITSLIAGVRWSVPVYGAWFPVLGSSITLSMSTCVVGELLPVTLGRVLSVIWLCGAVVSDFLIAGADFPVMFVPGAWMFALDPSFRGSTGSFIVCGLIFVESKVLTAVWLCVGVFVFSLVVIWGGKTVKTRLFTECK